MTVKDRNVHSNLNSKMVFMGHSFTFGGQELRSVFTSAVCKNSKCYSECYIN